MLVAIGKTPDASASHSVSAKKSAGEKTPEGPRKRQIAGEKGRSNLPKADLTAGNVGRISSPRYSEKSVYGWLAVQAVLHEPFSTGSSLLTGKLAGNFTDLCVRDRCKSTAGPYFVDLRRLLHQFWNREFAAAEQGNSGVKAGNESCDRRQRFAGSGNL